MRLNFKNIVGVNSAGIRQLVQVEVAPRPCSKCGRAMQFNSEDDDYFMFLTM